MTEEEFFCNWDCRYKTRELEKYRNRNRITAKDLVYCVGGTVLTWGVAILVFLL